MKSPARHLELRQRGARLLDVPASGSPSSVCGRGDRLHPFTLRPCRWIASAMAESSTVTTLRTKRDQIEGLIAHLEDRIKEARAVAWTSYRLSSARRMAEAAVRPGISERRHGSLIY